MFPQSSLGYQIVTDEQVTCTDSTLIAHESGSRSCRFTYIKKITSHTRFQATAAKQTDVTGQPIGPSSRAPEERSSYITLVLTIEIFYVNKITNHHTTSCEQKL